MAGFGAWLVTGSHTPQAETPPAAVGKPRRKIEEAAPAPQQGSVVTEWASACIKPAKGSYVTAADIRSSFEAWCRVRKVEPLSITAFGREMTRLKFEREKKGGMQRYGDIALLAAT
jgi:hypothetical protein